VIFRIKKKDKYLYVLKFQPNLSSVSLFNKYRDVKQFYFLNKREIRLNNNKKSSRVIKTTINSLVQKRSSIDNDTICAQNSGFYYYFF
jgi:hypothetical protein